MTELERAVQYIAIFANNRENWKYFVPVDAVLVTGESVRVGGYEIGPGPDDSWWLKDLTVGTTRRYTAVTS